MADSSKKVRHVLSEEELLSSVIIADDLDNDPPPNPEDVKRLFMWFESYMRPTQKND